MVGLLAGEFLGSCRTLGSNSRPDDAWPDQARFGKCLGLCGGGHDDGSLLGTLPRSLEGQRRGTPTSPTTIQRRHYCCAIDVQDNSTQAALAKRVSADSLGNNGWDGTDGSDRVVFAVKQTTQQQQQHWHCYGYLVIPHSGTTLTNTGFSCCI